MNWSTWSEDIKIMFIENDLGNMFKEMNITENKYKTADRPETSPHEKPANKDILKEMHWKEQTYSTVYLSSK